MCGMRVASKLSRSMPTQPCLGTPKVRPLHQSPTTPSKDALTMTTSINHRQPIVANIPATIVGAHVSQLLRSLPELARAHIAAAAKYETCLAMIALALPPASGDATAIEAEAFATSNPVRLGEQSAWALDVKADDIMPDPSARQRRRVARVQPTREERLRRLEEKKQRELAECRARSAERHREQRRASRR